MNTWKNFTCFGENHASIIDDKWKISDENVLEFSEVYNKNSKNHLLINIEIKKTHEDLQSNDEYMTNFTCFDENRASKIDDKSKISDKNVLEFSEV